MVNTLDDVEVVPTGAAVGAEVRGLDFAQKVPKEVAVRVNEVWAQHKVLLLRNQFLDKSSLYQAADVFVLPTSQENFGFVQFEAMACGTPVMTTNLVDTWREIVDSGGGVAVDQNAAAIVAGLQPLLDQPQVIRVERPSKDKPSYFEVGRLHW